MPNFVYKKICFYKKYLNDTDTKVDFGFLNKLMQRILQKNCLSMSCLTRTHYYNTIGIQCKKKIAEISKN